MNFKLLDTVNFDGEEVTEIELNLEKLKASDIDEAEEICRKLKVNAPVIELSKKYSVAVAHVATKLPIELFNSLSGRDYQRLHFAVSSFLNASESEVV